MTERNETPTEPTRGDDPMWCRLKRNRNEHTFDEDGVCRCGADIFGVLDAALQQNATLRSTVATLTDQLRTALRQHDEVIALADGRLAQIDTLTEQLREAQNMARHNYACAVHEQVMHHKDGNGCSYPPLVDDEFAAALAEAARLREGWTRGRWWRVLTPEGKLWCETSDEQEARSIAAERGWPLEHLWVNTREEWRVEGSTPAAPQPETEGMTEEAALDAAWRAYKLTALAWSDPALAFGEGWNAAIAWTAAKNGGRSSRQRSVSEWCARAFGAEHAASIEQRAVRMLEEAIEAYQAAGARADMAHRLVDHVFARPSGELSQELGGVGVTVLALAHAAGIDADDAERTEIARVMAKPLEHFAARNKAKNDAGFDVTAAKNGGR